MQRCQSRRRLGRRGVNLVRTSVVALWPAVMVVLGVGCASTGTVDEQLAEPSALFSDGIDAYVSFLNGDRGSVDYEYAVAKCMRERGFEYIPQVDTSPATAMPDQWLDLSEREIAEQYGFGISTTYEQTTVVPANLSDLAVSTPGRSNHVVLDELSEDEWFEWHFAHDGLTDEAGTKFDGCAETATANLTSSQRDFDEFAEQLEDHGARVRSDPDFVAARGVYEECFARGGFGYVDENEAILQLSEDFDELIAGVIAANGYQEIERTDDQGQALVIQVNPVLRGADLDALADMQETETEIATFALNCQEQGDPSIKEVRSRLDSEFVSTNFDLVSRITEQHS